MFKKNRTPIIFLIFLIFLAAFLRFYRLDDLMMFIPDQGWFYLSARDMILTGKIPLVGPPTSHPWIHHGPLWTYTLGILFLLFNFDPVAPAYFIALLGALTVVLFYYVVKKIYGVRLAVLSSLLFATSPLLIINSRIPYHTSPIPFFVIILFYFVYRWVKGSVWIFPAITFLLGVLYNHEITTFVYAICVGIVFFYGLFTKKDWSKKILQIKILAASCITFLIPMVPFILHDIQNGYGQTLKFLVWVVYRTLKAPLALIHPSFASSGSNPSTFGEFFMYYTQLTYISSAFISMVILIISLIFIIFIIKKYVLARKENSYLRLGLFTKSLKAEYALLGLFLVVGFSGLLTHRVPIEADTLLIAPFVVLCTSLCIFWTCRQKFTLALSVALAIAGANTYFLLHTNYLTQNTLYNRASYNTKLEAVDQVIELAGLNSYTIVGRGELSDFPVFLMPYEYLLWWKQKPINKTNPEKTIEIWEQGDIIRVTEIK